MSTDPRLLRDLLVCPSCRGALEWSDSQATCGCSTHPVVDGIPVLLPDDAQSDPYKLEQAEHHDSAPEVEGTRPHGSAAFAGWLWYEKFRRGIRDVPLRGRTAVVVCGGSGQEGEFLARHGARVVTSDISLGAARRAKARAERFGLEMLSIVADAERMPLLDRGVSLAFVLDGLHHLADPETGIAEMARVADETISINEPARAALTRLAVLAGVADEREASGNAVGRLDPRQVSAFLAERGFVTTGVERCGMYQRTKVGWPTRLASRSRVFPVATRAFRALDPVANRVGNKLAVRASRT